MNLDQLHGTVLSSYDEWTNRINEEFRELDVQVTKRQRGAWVKAPFDVNNLYQVIASLGLPHNMALIALDEIITSFRNKNLQAINKLERPEIIQIVYLTLTHLPAAENYFWALKYQQLCADRKIKYSDSQGVEHDYEDVKGLKEEIEKIIYILFEPAKEFDSTLELEPEWVNAWSEEVIESMRLGWIRTDISFDELQEAIRSFAIMPPKHWFGEKIYGPKFRNIAFSLGMANFAYKNRNYPSAGEEIDKILKAILEIVTLQIKFQIEDKSKDYDHIVSFYDLIDLTAKKSAEFKKILKDAQIPEDEFNTGLKLCRYLSTTDREISPTTIKDLTRFSKFIESLYDFERSKILSKSFFDKVKYIMKTSNQLEIVKKDDFGIIYEHNFRSSQALQSFRNIKKIMIHIVDEDAEITKSHLEKIYFQFKKYNQILGIIFTHKIINEDMKNLCRSLFLMEDGSKCIHLDSENIKDIFDDPSQLEEIISSEIVNCLGFVVDQPDYKNKIRKQKKIWDLPTNEIISLIESDVVEFKSSLIWDYEQNQKDTEGYLRKAVIKSIAAFLNSDGGVLLIGFDDDDENRRVLGLENDYKCLSKNQKIDGWYQKIVAVISSDLTNGETLHNTNIWTRMEKNSDKDICRINVKPSKEGFVYYIGKVKNEKSEPRVYVRKGNGTKELNSIEIVEYGKKKWGT